MSPLLTVRDLHLEAGASRTPILAGVNLSVEPGQAVGIVGESGSGKSMTLRSIMRLLGPSMQVHGSVDFDGASVLEMSQQQLRALRRNDIAMIFQDPRSSINPVRSVGDFLLEGLKYARGLTGKQARAEAESLLTQVGITHASRRLRQFPHEFSGGMLQRVMIASALGADVRLILADEPTTALDVSVQAEVLVLLDELRRDRDMSLLFVTHDLDVAVAICDRIAVMYAGRVVEDRPSAALYDTPQHPYTRALINCRPSVTGRTERLDSIPGNPVSASTAPPGCAFNDRCAYVRDECLEAVPPAVDLADGTVACVRVGELESSAPQVGGARG